MIIGSFVPAETPGSHVHSVRVLSRLGIMAKHNLTPREFESIKKELYNIKLLDILFSYPDGPRYDIALNLIATSR
jgi:hypothetical protein